jgi:DNA polymerase-1
LAAPEQIVAIDIETTSLNWRTGTLVGVAVANEEDAAAYYTWPEFIQTEHLTLRDEKIPKVFHNANFDMKFLMPRGTKLKGAIYDTLLMAQLIDENQPLDLKSLSVKYLGEDSIKHARAIWAWLQSNNLKKEHLARAPQELLSAYAKEDVNNTYKLFYVFWQRLEELNVKVKSLFNQDKGPMDYYLEEAQPTDYVLGQMETRGVRINLPLLQAKKREIEEDISKRLQSLNQLLQVEIHNICEDKYQAEVAAKKSPRGKANVKFPEFNWNSTDQVGPLFYSVLGLSKYIQAYTDTGKFKCSDEIWSQAAKIQGLPQTLGLAVKFYSDIKSLQKRLSTDIGGFDKKGKPIGLASKIDDDGRVYPQFKQIGGLYDGEANGTVTGRLSSAGPNTQNLQPFAKKWFIPDSDDYVFVHADYKQVEIVIAAHLSQDPRMLEIVRSGQDIHKQTAQKLYGPVELTKNQRNAGKGGNFLFIYNGSPWRLQTQLQTWGVDLTIDDCKRLHEGFFQEFTHYKEYLAQQQRLMLRYRAINSMFGRVRRLPELKYYDGLDFIKRKYRGKYEKELQEIFDKLPPGKRSLVRADGTKHEITLFDIANRKCRHAFNQGYNFPVQSVGGSITKRAMIVLNREGFDIVNQVHDSLIFQVKKTEIEAKVARIKQVMENVVKLSVPITVDIKLANSFDDEEDLYVSQQAVVTA